jgi:molecular chaperone DnaK
LVGIPAAPRGVPQIDVTFDIDANGIVNVSAKDKGTGKEQQVRIQASGGLSDAEVEEMVQSAESHAEEDKKRRESAEARNNAEALVHTTEKTLSEYGEKIEEGEREAIAGDIEALKAAIEGNDADDIRAKTEILTQSSMKLGEAMYQAQDGADEGKGAEGANNEDSDDGDDGEAPEDEGEVVDAEFEEVDDDKKNESA